MWTTRPSLVQRGDLRHVLEAVPRRWWILVRRHRHAQLDAADLAAVTNVDLAHFPWWRRWWGRLTDRPQQGDADLPDDDRADHPDRDPDHRGQTRHAVHANGGLGISPDGAVTVPRMRSETEWLLADPPVERLELGEGSWVEVVRGLVPGGDEVHDSLLPGTRWEQGQVFRYERWIDSPRLMAACPAGTQPAIDAVDTWLRQHYRVAFGAPALALYRDER